MVQNRIKIILDTIPKGEYSKVISKIDMDGMAYGKLMRFKRNSEETTLSEIERKSLLKNLKKYGVKSHDDLFENG